MVLPSSMRLKGNNCFTHLHRTGIRFNGQSMVLIIAEAQPKLMKLPMKQENQKSCRFAITISRKVSKRAVSRNRLRRLLHDHLRLRLENAKQFSNRWGLIRLKPCSLDQGHDQLLKECDRLLRNGGLLL